ncbi:transglycosylase SLT domain-containing protein [Thermodesulfobacteriota bacterium]
MLKIIKRDSLHIFKLVIFISTFFLIAPAVFGEGFPKVKSKHWTNKYDGYFRKYTKRYFGPGFNWKWFKSQAIAESNLDNDAKSWVNAKGIMQIIPRTFNEIKKKNPSFIDINEPRWNIAAGIYYDKRIYKKWKAPRPFSDLMGFTFAGYNAGFGTIVTAQKKCKQNGLNENFWENIKHIAPKVRIWRYKETLGYVDKIFHMMDY